MYAPSYPPQAEPNSLKSSSGRRAATVAESLLRFGFRYFGRGSGPQHDAPRRVRESEPRTYGHCVRRTCDATARIRLSTWVTSRERQQVDAGAIECARTAHRDTLQDVAADLANGVAEGALVSAARVSRGDVQALRALVHGFPSQIVLGLIGDTQDEEEAVAASLLFGQAGIRTVADVRTPRGWREFRGLLDCGSQPDEFMRQAIATVLSDIGPSESDLSDDRNELFRLMFSPRITSAKELAARLGVLPSTLMSRFYRAGLPAPKKYVTYARLVWAAHLGESPALSFSAIAHRLNASSPQSFHRTVRTFMGSRAGEFRAAFTGSRMLECFRSRLVIPYRETLRTFAPLADSLPRRTPRATRRNARRVEGREQQGRAA